MEGNKVAHIWFGGCCLRFGFHMGVMEYLREHFDLTSGNVRFFCVSGALWPGIFAAGAGQQRCPRAWLTEWGSWYNFYQHYTQVLFWILNNTLLHFFLFI